MRSLSSYRGAAAGAALFFTFAALALSGCSGAPPAAPEPTPIPTPEAASVVAIGHSGLTGVGSDPSSLGTSVLENSWATGTNPEVDSVYQRMLATDPALTAFNFAINGSDVESLLDTQAQQAVEVEPAPDLIIVQGVDNDIRCDGSDAENYEPFRADLTQVMDILTSGAPEAEVFFVGQWASTQAYAEGIYALDPEAQAGTGPCDAVDPATLTLDPSKIAHLQGLYDDYHQIVAEVCAEYENCAYGGEVQPVPLEAGDLSADLTHLTVSGHRKMAEIAWGLLG